MRGDLALAPIADDSGLGVARVTGRALAIRLERSGDRRPYVAPRRRANASDRFTELVDAMAVSLADAWTVERMAARACLGTRRITRHFTRRFRARFDSTPVADLVRLRLDAARTRLGSTAESLKRVAGACGFRDGDALRRAFERRFGLTPSEYRRRLGRVEPAR